MTTENEVEENGAGTESPALEGDYIHVQIARDVALRFRAALAFADLSFQQGVVAAIETWLTTDEDADLREIAPLNCTLGAATDIDGRTEVRVTRVPLGNADEEVAAVTDEVADLLERIGVDINGRNPFAGGGTD